MLIAQANINGTCNRRACITPSAFSIVNSCGGMSLFRPLRNSTTGHLIGLPHKCSAIRTSPVFGFSSLSLGDKATSMSCCCFASRQVRKSVTFPTEPLTSTPCTAFCLIVRTRAARGVLPYLDQHHLRADLKFTMWDSSGRYPGDRVFLPLASWFQAPAHTCPTVP